MESFRSTPQATVSQGSMPVLVPACVVSTTQTPSTGGPPSLGPPPAPAPAVPEPAVPGTLGAEAPVVTKASVASEAIPPSRSEGTAPGDASASAAEASREPAGVDPRLATQSLDETRGAPGGMPLGMMPPYGMPPYYGAQGYAAPWPQRDSRVPSTRTKRPSSTTIFRRR